MNEARKLVGVGSGWVGHVEVWVKELRKLDGRMVRLVRSG